MFQQKIKKEKNPIVFLTEKVAESIHYSLPKQIQKNTPIWTKDYFNLCMNLNKID